MSQEWQAASIARQPGPTMTLEQGDAQGVRVVQVAGELDMSNVGALRDATSALPNDALGIVVDLRGASFIDSATIGCLMDLYRQAHNVGGHLKLSGVQKRVETMLTMTGAQNFIQIHSDEPSALASFGA